MIQSPLFSGNESDALTRLQAIHERLIESWKYQNHTSFVPMIYPDIRPGSVLFIGINPSLHKSHIIKVLKGTEFEKAVPDKRSVEAFFTFRPEQIRDELHKWQAIQTYHRHKLDYFERHRQLASVFEVTDQWEQLDLFQLRESKQVNLEALLKKNINDSFFQDQLGIFFDLLALMAPRLIIVMNRKTGDILKKRWLTMKLDESVLEPTVEEDVFILSFRQQCIPIIFSIHYKYKPAPVREQLDQRIIDLARTFLWE